MKSCDRLIRLASRHDVPAIAELEQQFFFDAWSENMLIDCLSQPHYVLSVCEDRSGRVVGYLITTHIAGETELLRIGVSIAHRRQGIGRELMLWLIKLCRERETVDIFLEVRDSNQSAISLYEQFGFTSLGKRKNYYHHPDEDARLMAAKLNEMPDFLA